LNRKEVELHSILIALVGSHAYGLNTPASDKDIRGIFMASIKYQLGIITKRIEQKDKGWNEPGIIPELDNTEDICIYEFRKMIDLLLNNNPNCLELLYIDNYILLTDAGKELIANRDLFLSTKVKYTYSGYAYSQIKRVENHRKWLLEPPTKKPEWLDFGLDDTSFLNHSQINTFLEFLWLLVRDKIEYMEAIEEFSEFRDLLLEKIDFKAILKTYPLPSETIEYVQELTRGSNDFINLLQRSHAYLIAKRNWDNYQSWLKNRNPKRAELERSVGYDAKHICQCLRLLYQGIEILETGNLTVSLKNHPNYEFLKAVKAGTIPYGEVKTLADELFNNLDIAYAESKLPKKPNSNAINDLCVELISKAIHPGKINVTTIKP